MLETILEHKGFFIKGNMCLLLCTWQPLPLQCTIATWKTCHCTTWLMKNMCEYQLMYFAINHFPGSAIVNGLV